MSVGNSIRQNLRRAGFAFFGIFNGTEYNPHFFEQIEQAVDRRKGAVLVCGIGGILEPLGRGGRQSRSAARHKAPGCVEKTNSNPLFSISKSSSLPISTGRVMPSSEAGNQ